MSVVSKNPFELLGDDGEAPQPAAAPKKVEAAKAPSAPKAVPGAAQKGGARGGRYPARGGARTVYQERVTEADPGFEGERVAPTKKEHTGRDRHTKGPREDRSHTGPRSRAPGAAAARGGKGARGPRGGAAGGAGGEGQKKAAPAESWNNDEGKAELSAENQGEKDGAEAAVVTEEAVEEEVVEEDNSKTLDQYLAEKAQQALGGTLGKKEVRQVEEAEGTAFTRSAAEGDDFFAGKAKSTERKEKAPKKEKVFIEVDGQFANPAGRSPRTERPAGRGRGAPRGAARGGQAQRGAARGGARAPRQAPVDTADSSAFPALGA